MADPTQQLVEYNLQLQQVEAALTSDPENEELTKLKTDLEEVILLTTDLLVQQAAELEAASSLGGDGETSTGDASISASSAGSSIPGRSSATVTRDWQVGDKCMAMYEADQQMYEAVIDEILPDGTVTMTFDGYDNTEVTQLALLQSVEEGRKRAAEEMEGGASAKKQNKKEQQNAQREYKRKKALKKAQRLKEMDEVHEKEKNKWLDFNSKTFSKSSKGRVKRSIFATPDEVTGRVGVGTCGVGGRPMTGYHHAEKYKKQ